MRGFMDADRQEKDDDLKQDVDVAQVHADEISPDSSRTADTAKKRCIR
jgi:hypothetical protein